MKLKTLVAENDTIFRVGLCTAFALFLLLQFSAAEVLGEEDVSSEEEIVDSASPWEVIF